MKAGAILALLVLGLGAVSSAQDGLTGIQLYQFCQAKDPKCELFLGVIVPGLNKYQSDRNLKTFCLPTPFTMLQARLVIDKYMREHPEQLHVPADWVVALALATAFPC
jgi:hypothetical protein